MERPLTGWEHRYVRAHFSLLTAEERAQWVENIDLFAKTLLDFIHTHYFKEIPFSKKKDCLKEFADIWGLKFSCGLLVLLLDNQRLQDILLIVEIWKEHYYRTVEKQFITITTAKKESDENIKDFLKKCGINNKNNEITQKVVPELIGGAIIETDGMCYDLSVLGRINQIKRNLLNETF